MNTRPLHSFSIKNIFYDKMDVMLFYFLILINRIEGKGTFGGVFRIPSNIYGRDVFMKTNENDRRCRSASYMFYRVLNTSLIF